MYYSKKEPYVVHDREHVYEFTGDEVIQALKRYIGDPLPKHNRSILISPRYDNLIGRDNYLLTLYEPVEVKVS